MVRESLPVQSRFKIMKKKVAVIGTGIAGMGCAHHLNDYFDLTLFEQNDYVGGHTNTIVLNEDGKDIFVDTGFMVFNYKTYPHLCKLFKDIGAPVKKTNMSFSVQHVPTGLEYCGSGLSGLFAQRKNIFNLRFIRLLSAISSFNNIGPKVLANENFPEMTLGEFMYDYGFGEDMLWKYLIPMSSAVWSTPMEKMLDFPVTTLIRFFYNHGFLGLNTQHQWYTLINGSQSYREILIKPFREKIRCNCEIVKAVRKYDQTVLQFRDGKEEAFHSVIFACHADQSLKILGDPTPLEKGLLSAFKYQENMAVLHTDESVMPRTKRAWCSWNFRMENKQHATTIYWMNKLQQVSEKNNYFVSINPIPGSIKKEKIIREILYEHPLFDLFAINAQKRLHELNKKGPFYFCGSYFKYGFHEDAYASAVSLSKKIIKNENEVVPV
jgi:predicted NAD/FAD-binding protein